MKRRGFLKLLVAAPIALAVKPLKSPRISDKDIMDARFKIIEEKMKEAMAEIIAKEDRQLFALMRKAA